MTKATSKPTRDLAALIAETPASAMSEAVRLKAQKVAMNSTACIVAGAGSETAPGLLAYARQAGGACASPILGTAHRVAPEVAALVNGSFGHALEYDDVFAMLPGHPGAVVIAALIGDIERGCVSGQALTEAFIIGYETAARLGIAMTLEHHRVRGFHATSTLGVLAAAASIARLRKLDTETTCRVLSVAASFASGLLGQIGTSMKPVHSGWAARNAVAAADLVASGITGGDDLLENAKGFFVAYGTAKSNAERVTENFGAPWAIETPGVSLKKYPCCFAAHRGIDAILALREEHKVRFEDVARVICRVPPHGLANMVHRGPQTGLEAKFSMEYSFVSALLDGQPTLASYTDAAVQRGIAQRSLGMVACTEDVACEEGLGEAGGTVSSARGFVEITLELKSGKRLVRRVTHAPGTPARELTLQELEQKIGFCADHAGFSPAARAAMQKALLAYDSAADLRPVLRAMIKST